MSTTLTLTGDYPDPKCQPPSAHNYHRVARNGNMNKSTQEQ